MSKDSPFVITNLSAAAYLMVTIICSDLYAYKYMVTAWFMMQQVEKERNDIYEAFQNALSRVRDQTDSQHLLLEHKIENAEESIISTTLQLEEIAVVSGMSNQEIKSITESYDNKLDPLNTRILNLQHKLTEIRKAYSNSMGTYLRELRKEGVPEDKIGEVFAHKIPEAETSTHMGLFAAA